MRLVIRAFASHDKASILQLNQDAESELPIVVIEDYFNDLDDVALFYRDGAFFVAEVDAMVVGCIGLTAEGELVRLRVSGRHRRQGIATELVNRVLSFATSQ